MTRPAAFLLAAMLAVAPAAAQDVPDSGAQDDRKLQQGMDRLSEGTRLILEAILGELAPVIEELQSMIDDLSAYEAPEMLPNGDIIIRRKPDAPAPQEDLPPSDGGEIEL
ncbi:AAA+ family ATPase [Rhodovulum sp. YNF3179]|uniref:AAA+ family ATPase n=1 Tax=Rhodovulum sp. YNF3179 TaxID=3425127 RepID=UPI003D338C3A